MSTTDEPTDKANDAVGAVMRSAAIRHELVGKMEIVVHEALKTNGIILDLDDIRRNARWMIYPDERKVLEYKGYPILELWPLETKLDGEHFVASHKYRILSTMAAGA